MTGPRHLAAATLAAALLLAHPATAHAQARPRATAAKPSTAARSAATAPLEAPPPAPAPTAAPASSEPGPLAAPIVERGPWRPAVVLGYEKDSDAELKGPHVQLELERDLVPLGSRGRLSFVTAAAWFHGADSVTTTAPGTTISQTVDTTVEVVELVPSFRAAFALVPRLRLFVDVGVGGGWTTGSAKASSSAAPGVVTTVSSDSFLGVLRLSAGGTFAVNERLRLGVELPTLVRRYGEKQSQTLSFSALAAYAF
ncbi:MAG TPA: hypothetical protein VLT61_00965 [Anaeromyxobacteraceae bacterium]|nr:hypothetical protein [Anaeromyxobacteraceae bacterium]